jgi:hypothetical protein
LFFSLIFFVILKKIKTKNMKQGNIFKIAFCFLLISNIGYGQILTETFDNKTQFTSSEGFFSDGSGDYFGIYDPVGSTDDFGTGSQPSGIPAFTGNNGNYLVGEDFDGDGFAATQTLTWTELNITGYTDLNFSVKLAATNGFDASSDEITLAVNIDGAGYVDITKFKNPSGFNAFPTNGTITLGLALQTITGNISGTGSSMDLRLTVSVNSGSEEFGIDDIVIDGTSSGPATPGITLSPVSGNTNESGTTATFTAVLNAQPTTNVVLNISSANTNEVTVSPATLTFTNANWETPQQITLTGVNDVLFDGNQDVIITLSVDDPSSDDTYNAVLDVTITVTNEDDDVAPSIGFGTTTSSENETNVTFTSANIPITVSNYSAEQIDINVSVTGGTAEMGDYTFTSPTALSFTANGTQNITVDINDDADTNNETIIFTITETSSVTGLIISQATHTLTIVDDEVAPIPTLIITEVGDPIDFAGRFVEIYNNGSSAIDLGASEIYFVRQSNGTTFATLALTGIIQPNTIMTIGSSTSSVTSYGFGTTFDSGIINGNGDDGYFLYYGGDNTTGTLLDAYGVLNQDGTGFPWEYLDSRAFRINTTSVSPNATWTSSEWTIASANLVDMTPGALENEFRYDGAWKPKDISNAIVTNNIYVESNVTLSANLEINDFVVNTAATASINSGIALKVNGISSGNVTYNRTLGTENWYLVSSPVAGEAYDNAYVAANSLAINGSNNAIGTYNDAASTGSKWSYMQTNAGATFTSGTGYTLRRATAAGAGDIYFTGTINTSDVPLTVATAGTGFNLIGNPYTSHLNSASFLTDNTSNLVSQTLWVFNQSSGNYVTYVTASAFMLAPTQGFFVRASATSLNIAESYQAITGGTFQKSAKTEVKLMMTDGTADRFAKVYYLDNATTSFDNGYDGETFGGISTTLDVFTQLLSNDEGKKYQLQSLPNSDYENMIVPVGVIANAGKEIIFTTEAINLPSGINVYLEDKLTNTFTRLDEANSNYKVTLSENANGIGRFYLHTKSSTLSVTDVTMNAISIYKTTNSTLRITGLSQGKASISMYTMLGKQVLNSDFTSNGVSDIALPKLATGIYIVHLATENGTLNKKITLE